MSIEFDNDTKLKFAMNLYLCGSAYDAAISMFPNEVGVALSAAVNLPEDTVVIKELDRLKKTGATLDLLPNESVVLKKLWDKLQQPCIEDKDFISGVKLYSEIRGYIKKNPEIVVNNQPKQKVLVIPASKSIEEWEEKAMKQQKDLTDVARTKH